MKDDNSIDEKKPAPRLRRIGDIGINRSHHWPKPAGCCAAAAICWTSIKRA